MTKRTNVLKVNHFDLILPDLSGLCDQDFVVHLSGFKTEVLQLILLER